MKLFKGFLLSLFLMIGSFTFSQSWSSSTYYAERGGYRNEVVGSFQKWICCDYYGNGYYAICYNYKETIWVEKYGSREVKVWYGNNWRYEWQTGYYWSYSWRYYTSC